MPKNRNDLNAGIEKFFENIMVQFSELKWNGKESRVANGRVAVCVPGHPKANSTGYVPKARWLMEQKLGRFLLESEEVHHKNESECDDNPDNLEIKSTSGHAKHHWPKRAPLMNGPADRRLDYARIKELIRAGNGYRRIARMINEPLYSVKKAVVTIKKDL